MVEIPEVSTSRLEPQTDKGNGKFLGDNGKEKVPGDRGKEQVPESVNPDAHFAQLDTYSGCNLLNATFVKLIGEMLEDFKFPATHSNMVPS